MGKKKQLPQYLEIALRYVCMSSGEDIGYALGHVHRSTAHAYMSQLRAKGLAYTYYKERGCLEVWPTRDGSALYATLGPVPD